MFDESLPVSAKPSPDENGGNLHRADPGRREPSRPHIATEAGAAEPRCVTAHRVLRIKIDKIHAGMWNFLRQVAAEEASYMNHVIDACWCEARGFKPPGDDSNNPSKEIRRRFKGRLSGAAYVAAEREARSQWRKAMGKALNGWSGAPRFDANRALTINGNGASNPHGVQFIQVKTDAKGEPVYALKVLLLKKGEGTPEEYRRVALPIAKHSARDRFQGSLLAQFASGEIAIDKLTLVFHPEKRRIMAHLAWQRKVYPPVFGERVATIGPIDPKHDRLTVRLWHDGARIAPPKDYSRRLFHFRKMKRDYDKVSRRQRYSIGRSKGSRRLLRSKLARSFDQWVSQANHKWSAELIAWLATQGVCRLDVLPITHTDWPAYELIQMLRYKGAVVGIDVVEVSMEEAPREDETTYKAAVASTKKQQKRAKKREEAVRTLASDFEKEE